MKTEPLKSMFLSFTKEISVKSAITVLRFALCVMAFTFLSACASTSTVSSNLNASPENDSVADLAADQIADQDDDAITGEAEIDPALPLLELDANLLEQLLVSNLASYQGKWGQASSNAFEAAQSTKDHRLARLGTLLALRARDYATAAQSAALWFELQPDSNDAENLLVISQVGAGQISQVLESLERQRGSEEIDLHIRKTAGLLVRQSNGDAAFEVVSHYVNTHPDSAQVMISSAYVAETFGKVEQSAEWAENAIQIRPDWDLAAQMKAGILGRQGKLEERAKFIEDYVSTHPASVNMRINHAVELARKQRYQEALELMQDTLVNQPNNVPTLSYAAALALQLEDVPLAKKYYEKSLRRDIRNDDARWALARIAVTEKKYAKAENYYNDITNREQIFAARLQVANMRYHTKGIKSAINTLRAIEPISENQYVDIALTRHYLLMQAHQYDRALGFINESIIYLPENLELLYSRALVAAELRKLEIAEADFRKVLEIQPDHANALNAFGYTLADQTDRLDEARELIAQALTLRPQDAHILDSMGWVAYRQNDLVMAMDFLQKAFDASPETEIAAHLGEVLWELGEHDKAKQIWQKSYNDDSQNPVLNETLERYGVQLDVSTSESDQVSKR